jgi:hypothetical protein
MVTSGNSPSAGMTEFSYARIIIEMRFLDLKWAGTYAEVWRTTVGISLPGIHAFEDLHGATKKATGIHGIAMLPVGPYFINHL